MPFDYQPTLKGYLVELRPLTLEDFDALRSVAADPGIWEQHPVKNRHMEDVFREFFDDALACGGTLVAVDTTTREVIGSSRFHGYDGEQSEVEIGWSFLARSHWGGAYNGEMKKLMLRHAFRFVETVVLLVTPQNVRSRRAVEKIGGTLVGMRPDAGGRNSLEYQVSSSTFRAGDIGTLGDDAAGP